MAVNERRTLAGANVIDRGLERCIADDGIGAVDFVEMEVGESLDQLADVAARRAHFHRHRNGVLVIFDQVQHGQLQVRRGVQRLPELAFAGGAIAAGDVNHFVAVELYILELAIIAAGLLRGLRIAIEIASRFGAAHGLQKLRSRRRRLGHDVQLLVSPVRRHLPSAGVGIVGRAYGFQQLLVRRHAQGKAERAVAIVGIEPVVAGAQHHSGGNQQRFVSRARDLKEDLLLALEQDLAVVDPARHVHQPVDFDQLLGGEPFIFRIGSGFRLYFCGGHPLPQV